MITYPYIFQDTDKLSETYGEYCIRWTETFSTDGYLTKKEALQEINRLQGE